ncbi:hypothetical protein [Streptomyces altiplanensis]
MDQRTRIHLKAIGDELKPTATTPDGSTAQLFISGMLTGMATAVRIADGSTAEKALQLLAEQLAAATGRACPDGKPDQATAPTDTVQHWTDQAATYAEQRDGAYRERAHLVAWLAALHPSVIVPAPDVEEPGWQIVYITAGGWQMSWHIAPGDAELFKDVEHVPADDPRALWDGHSTEQKYTRIRQHTRVIHTNQRLNKWK